MLIWGSRLFGKVDDVPGLFYVATRFGHLFFFPMIPRDGYVVFNQSSEGWNGCMQLERHVDAIGLH